MKVLMHLNHGRDETYLLVFPRSVTTRKIKEILEGDRQTAMCALLMASRIKIKILPQERQKAGLIADFVVSEKYTSERLA